MFKKSLVAIAMSSMALVGCSEPQVNNTPQAPAQAEVAQVSVEEASKQANAVFDKIFMDAVKRNPVSQTYLGIKDDYDKWNDLSEENAVKEIEYAKQSLATIKAIDPSNLDAQTKLSRTLFIQQIEQQIADFKWRYHSYPVNQMFGTHSQIPAF